MSSRTQGFVLLLFGVALIRLATADALLRYVRPVARPWVLLAGCALAGLALWSLVAGARREEAVDEHGHRGASRVTWLVLAPVVAILVIAPPALGAFSAERVPATTLSSSTRDDPPLHGPDPVRLTLLDYFLRGVAGAGRTLSGHRVALSGFVVRAEPGGFEIARLVITCCAADATPVFILVRTREPAPAQDTWVTAVGSYGGLSPADATVPVLRADTVTVIRQPRNPYD